MENGNPTMTMRPGTMEPGNTLNELKDPSREAATKPRGPRVELTILMPCLNEEETLEACIRKAHAGARRACGDGQYEIVVVDNGSTDASPKIALDAGARLIRQEMRGYGAALLAGIQAAQGKFVVMGDADDSYDFREVLPFVEKLREGYDLVLGNRFWGGIQPGAMPWLHKYVGNPLLSFLGRLFFRVSVGDFHCGLRAFRREAILDLHLVTTGMEFASEMVVKSALHRLRIAEVATILYPDGRTRSPHLRTWHDGWRHLRFLLLYSPRWLFLYPGLAAVGVGILASSVLLSAPIRLGDVRLDIGALLFAATLIVLGTQACIFALFTKVYAIQAGLLPPDPALGRRLQRISLEAGLLAGGLITLGGLAMSALATAYWQTRQFGNLDPEISMRLVIPGAILCTLGVQVILASLFLSILALPRR